MAEYASIDIYAADVLRVWPPRPPLVGMIGYARSGKDTVAARLAAHRFARFAFADKLREAVLALNPIVEWLPSFYTDGSPEPVRLSEIVAADGWEKAKEYPEVRRVLQHYGMAVRAIDEDFWVRPVMTAIASAGAAVITDVRFPNEAIAVRRAGGVLVRVARPGVGPVNDHDSETALDDLLADFTIHNDSTIAALHRMVDAWHAREIAA